MNIEQLYQKTVINQALNWVATTTPTDDLLNARTILNIEYQKDLKSFMNTNPESPITNVLKSQTVSDKTEEDEINISSKLYKKYNSLRHAKQPADTEYYKLLEDMIQVTKQRLKESSTSQDNLTYCSDNKLGDSSYIINIIEKMANISKKFLKEKPRNTYIPLQDITKDDIDNYLLHYPDIQVLESNATGSCMFALDKDNSRIHISSNKINQYDTVSSYFHEVGHALYQNRILSKNTDIGKIGQYISLSLHESSSIIHEIALAGIDYTVKNDPINLFRLGTDKVHYIIHIFIRMKIEELLFTEKITVQQIDETWNNLVEEYIGIRPSNQWEGFMQDVHWGSGSFGYFHSYAIGFFNAVTMLLDIEDSLGNDRVENTRIILSTINKWYGSYNEYSEDILKDMHTDLDKSMLDYEDFIMQRFTYSS